MLSDWLIYSVLFLGGCAAGANLIPAWAGYCGGLGLLVWLLGSVVIFAMGARSANKQEQAKGHYSLAPIKETDAIGRQYTRGYRAVYGPPQPIRRQQAFKNFVGICAILAVLAILAGVVLTVQP
jgi:hypothetical protein